MLALTMGQAEILEFFEAYPRKWYDSSEIRQHIGGSQSTVATGLMKCRKLDLIDYKAIRTPCVKYLYREKE